MSRPFGLVFFRGDLQFKANMSSGGKTLSFAFLLLTFTTGSAFAGDCIKNDYVPGFGCNPIANICQLTCQEGQDCAFYPEGGCTAALANNETVNHADMNPDKCEQLCRLSDEVETEEGRCRFWRYVSFCPHLYAIDYGVYDNIPQEVVEFSETVCSLMNLNQCTEPLDCVSDGEKPSCRTDDVGCPNGAVPDPNPGTPCTSGIIFKTEPGYIHWGCVNELEDLGSPYDQDVATMPPNTYCTTSHRQETTTLSTHFHFILGVLIGMKAR